MSQQTGRAPGAKPPITLKRGQKHKLAHTLSEYDATLLWRIAKMMSTCFLLTRADKIHLARVAWKVSHATTSPRRASVARLMKEIVRFEERQEAAMPLPPPRKRAYRRKARGLVRHPMRGVKASLVVIDDEFKKA